MAFSIEDLRESVEHLHKQLLFGCGNHGCRIRPPPGQGTNSICQCTPVAISKTLLDLATLTEQMGSDWVWYWDKPQPKENQ